jgi:hypothetical protein
MSSFARSIQPVLVTDEQLSSIAKLASRFLREPMPSWCGGFAIWQTHYAWWPAGSRWQRCPSRNVMRRCLLLQAIIVLPYQSAGLSILIAV